MLTIACTRTLKSADRSSLCFLLPLTRQLLSSAALHETGLIAAAADEFMSSNDNGYLEKPAKLAFRGTLRGLSIGEGLTINGLRYS